MIQIRKDSWHYKLYGFENKYKNEPGDLCSYARGIIGSLLWIVFRDGAMIASGTILVCCMGLHIMEDGWWIGVIVPLLIVLGCSAAVIAVFGGYYLIESWFGGQNITELSGVRLVVEYAKAKKEKYCPLVQIVDPKEDKRA